GPAAGRSAAEPVDLQVPVRGPDRRGWELAQWAVARASTLRVAEVSYGGKVWRADDSGGDWESAPSAGDAAPKPPTVHLRLTR
ncbi:hypothetical protein AB1388_41100, partial [Streptomyces hydrogenans]